jgi:hypothetical protein
MRSVPCLAAVLHRGQRPPHGQAGCRWRPPSTVDERCAPAEAMVRACLVAGEAVGWARVFISAMQSSAVCFGLDECSRVYCKNDGRFYRDRAATL